MKKSMQLKPINTIEPEFRDRSEFLRWREQILNEYEQSKIIYKKEMEQLFDYIEEQES